MEPEGSLPHSQVDPFHDGMARPQVADGGTDSNVEDIWENIE